MLSSPRKRCGKGELHIIRPNPSLFFFFSFLVCVCARLGSFSPILIYLYINHWNCHGEIFRSLRRMKGWERMLVTYVFLETMMSMWCTKGKPIFDNIFLHIFSLVFVNFYKLECFATRVGIHCISYCSNYR